MEAWGLISNYSSKFKTSSRDHDGSMGSTPRVHRHRHRHRHTQAHTHNLSFFVFYSKTPVTSIKVAAVTTQGGYDCTQRCTEISECHDTEIKDISVHQGAGARVQVPECCSAALARFSPQLAARRARTKRLGGPLGCGRCSTTQLPPASRR